MSERWRILLVDGDPAAGDTLRALLPAGDVTHARTFDEGLTLATAGGFDALVLEHRLGDRGGVELLRACRAAGVAAPALMVTARGDEQAAVDAMKAGVVDYFVKQRLTPELLLVSLRHARERGERERQLRQAEDALRASEEHLRQIARIGNDTVWVLDIAIDRRTLSEQFETVFGHPLREVQPAQAWWWDKVHPEDQVRARREFEAFARGEAPAWQEEYRLQRADGTWAHVLDRAYLLRDAAGQPVRVVGTLVDLTVRVRREEELRQSLKMEAIGRLAGGVAHDFNNLLTAIIGYSELLVPQLPAGPQRRAGEQIRAAGQRAAALTHQLLAFSRKQVLQPEPLDLNKVVRELESMLRRLIGEHIEVATDLASELGRVRADRAQLEQVIVNLAVNARDAMPRGGTLSITTRPAPPIAPDQPGGAVLSVRDTGHGMTPDVLAHLFEPFFTTKPMGKGTGLGLSTVYGIVKQSGGDVRVESAPGRGTTFYVTLPTAEASPSAGHRRPTAHVPGGKETVLVVEDEDAVRQLVREVLLARGYEVLEAARGDEALGLAAAREGPIHLLLTDVVMPGMSGVELVQRLAGVRHDVRVLFMSGYTGESFARAELEAGASVLEKPFTPDALAAAVRQALDAPPG